MSITADHSGDARASRPRYDASGSRHEARWRNRRIIMNNDGLDLKSTSLTEPVTPELFLSRRTSPLADSQVDAIFYCDGTFNRYTHRSQVSEELNHEWLANPVDEPGYVPWAKQLADQGRDTLELVSDWCNAHGREIFWSMRMNDLHDSGASRASIVSQWKRAHPHCLMGAQPAYAGSDRKLGKHMLNYADPEVRTQVERIVADVTERDDIDGVELDFFRHPFFFLPQMLGEPVTDEHRAMMTDLVGRLRALMDAAAERRERPMLMAVRVPDDLAFCRSLGLDVEQWLRDGWVDLIAHGDYFKLRPWTDWAALGRTFDVPVYACLDGRRITGGGSPGDRTDLPRWRGEALRAWRAGVNGVYTFNRFNPHDPIFRELGDPHTLQSLEHIDHESFTTDDGSRLDPRYWLAS